MTCKVAIDLGLNRLFDYEVPEVMKEKLAVGQLLSVPFGHREARGFVLAIDDSTAGVLVNGEYKLKPISEIIDETPFFSVELIELVKKVSAYTAAPLESVLKAALPAAVLKKNVRPRELLFVEPALAAEPVEMTKRLQWLYDQIVRLGGGWMASLCKELKTTPTAIRALGERGLVRVAIKERRRDPLAGRRILPSKPMALNEEQKAALKTILGAVSPVVLLGVTGSGKTEVYLQAIAHELEEGRGAIVMVPEISLTPQTVQRFASRFGDKVAVLHSALSDGERYDEWHRIRAGVARVVVGPRSAVWAPVKRLGLIVVDEEHDSSYKQDEMPRYHARDVAVLRAAVEGCRVMLGSATPSLESWLNVKRGRYELAEMKHRAGAGTFPIVQLVDMNEESRGGAIFTQTLLDAIHCRLDRGEQVILFLNRRGYSTSFICTGVDCGEVMTCEKCGIPYTYHLSDKCLRCHVCGRWIPIPEKCPKCGAKMFQYKGIGTQRVEAALKRCFPKAGIIRMDADSVSRKNSHDDLLGAFRRREADILVGTQMIAKGLDFPNVTLVGVLNADSSLMQDDFRAAERTFQLIAQVSGRAGRAELPGEVIVQSYDPTVPAIRAAVRGDFVGFADEELASRKAGWFPPYCHLALISLRAKDLKLAADWAVMYATSLKKAPKIRVLEAMPSPLEKADGWFRWQIIVRSDSVASIIRAWHWINSVRPPEKKLRFSIDIDAQNLV